MHEGSGCRAYRVAVALVLVPVNLLLRHEWRHAERLPRSGGVPRMSAVRQVAAVGGATRPAVPFHLRPLQPVPDDARRSA